MRWRRRRYVEQAEEFQVHVLALRVPVWGRRWWPPEPPLQGRVHDESRCGLANFDTALGLQINRQPRAPHRAFAGWVDNGLASATGASTAIRSNDGFLPPGWPRPGRSRRPPSLAGRPAATRCQRQPLAGGHAGPVAAAGGSRRLTQPPSSTWTRHLGSGLVGGALRPRASRRHYFTTAASPVSLRSEKFGYLAGGTATTSPLAGKALAFIEARSVAGWWPWERRFTTDHRH